MGYLILKDRSLSTAREWLMMQDTYANETYGRPVSSAVAGGTCVSCNQRAHDTSSVAAAQFYSRTGVCERCQNTHRSIADNIVPFNQKYRAHAV
jgi:hypothetical protein